MSITDTEISLYQDCPHMFGRYLGYNDLTDIHSEWILDAWVKDKYAMQAHRNSFKTTSILIVGAIWFLLLFDPNKTILIIRKARDESRKIIKTLKGNFESKECSLVSQYIYGKNILKTANWSADSITLSIKESVSPEGNIDCIGVGGSITGSHYDYIFPDDIITLKDRTSKAERENTKIFVRELKNIVKYGGKIYYSGTPWHRDDAWTILPKPALYPIGSIDIPGFRPDEIDAHMAELRRGNTESLISANYKLVHISDEERIFPDPKFAKWDFDTFETVGYIDPAYHGSNTTALTLIAKVMKPQKEGEKKSYDFFCTGFVWSKNIIDIYDDIVHKLTMYKCGTLYNEANADKGLSARDLSKLWGSVRAVYEKENKHMKILGYGKQHFSDIFFDDQCQNEYLNQILDYKEGEEPDDAPDSFSALLRQMGFSGAKVARAPKVNIGKLGL